MERTIKKIISLSLATGLSLFLPPAVAYVCDVKTSDVAFGATKNEALQLRDASLCAIAQKMDVQGHRGISGFPNNSLESFRAAYAAGSETIELDLQITSDDEILVAHDPTVSTERCVKDDGRPLSKTILRNMSATEAREVECAEDKYSAKASTAPMPTLSEVFKEFENTKTVTGQPARLNIEIKYDRDKPQYFPTPEKYVEKIVEKIRAGGWPKERYFVQSFDQEILKILKAQAPEIEVVPLVGNAKDAVKAVKNVGSKMVTPSFTTLTPAIMADLQKMNVKTIPWTPNTEEEMMKVISLGVDGIITDRADLFLKVRDRLCNK